jgi:hypothetical protein
MQESLAMRGMIEHSHYGKCVMRSRCKSDDKLRRGRVNFSKVQLYRLCISKSEVRLTYILMYLYLSSTAIPMPQIVTAIVIIHMYT